MWKLVVNSRGLTVFLPAWFEAAVVSVSSTDFHHHRFIAFLIIGIDTTGCENVFF